MNGPKIIITMHYMELGGAETALLGLLEALTQRGVQVDLFVYAHRGELMAHIPDAVNVLPQIPVYADIESPMTTALRHGHVRLVLARLKARLAHRRHVRTLAAPPQNDASIFQYVGNAVSPVLPDINPGVCYDLCISFMTPHNIAADHVRARRRVAWIHADYASQYNDTAAELDAWSRFDRIVSISPAVTRSFVSVFPTLADRIVEVENILPRHYIATRLGQDSQSPEFRPVAVKLLSVGRLCYAKNFDNIPGIARLLVERHGLDIQWIIIGDGGDRGLIEQRIAQAGVSDRVHLVGKKDNPYPYIAACDIYVQPSRTEGKSITVREAQMLGRPVVIANYTTAASQVSDGVDGLIADGDNDSLARAIARLCDDGTLRDTITRNIAARDYVMADQAENVVALCRDKN